MRPDLKRRELPLAGRQFLRVALGLTLAIVGTAAGSGVRPAWATTPEDPALPWQRLEFTASKLFLTATTQVELRWVSRSEAEAAWLASPDLDRAHGAVLQPGPHPLLALSLDTAFAGRHTTSTTWFDSGQGTVFQSQRQRSGRKAYQKTYRFTTAGTFSLRQAPADQGQAALEPNAWTQRHTEFYPHPTGLSECAVISEPAVLLYWITAHLPRENQPVSFCTYSNKTVQVLTLTATAAPPMDVDYTLRRNGQRVSRRAAVPVWKVLVEPKPTSNEAKEAFEFLGLEGAVEIQVERENRLPVQISGRIPKLGTVLIGLKAAILE